MIIWKRTVLYHQIPRVRCQNNESEAEKLSQLKISNCIFRKPVGTCKRRSPAHRNPQSTESAAESKQENRHTVPHSYNFCFMHRTYLSDRRASWTLQATVENLHESQRRCHYSLLHIPEKHRDALFINSLVPRSSDLIPHTQHPTSHPIPSPPTTTPYHISLPTPAYCTYAHPSPNPFKLNPPNPHPTPINTTASPRQPYKPKNPPSPRSNPSISKDPIVYSHP